MTVQLMIRPWIFEIAIMPEAILSSENKLCHQHPNLRFTSKLLSLFSVSPSHSQGPLSPHRPHLLYSRRTIRPSKSPPLTLLNCSRVLAHYPVSVRVAQSPKKSGDNGAQSSESVAPTPKRRRVEETSNAALILLKGLPYVDVRIVFPLNGFGRSFSCG